MVFANGCQRADIGAEALDRMPDYKGQRSESHLRYVMADAINSVPISDELVQNLLLRGGFSCLYGDSNSGKTFLAINIAACVATGTNWMRRNTEQGIVVYLAAESPRSVQARMFAVQKHLGVMIPNLAIVTNPLNLHGGATDGSELIVTVREIEQRFGQRCELIVGDTLARLTAGGNENSGEDMGALIGRVDQIRESTGAHVMLIHHSGKDASKGARGWSGIRAALDTEIEVTANSVTGVHCAEVTKQRDLPGGGDRIGFSLKPVQTGVTKWGAPQTSCVVVPADVPNRLAKRKRESEIAQAITKRLIETRGFQTRGDLRDHLGERFQPRSINREVKKMLDDGRLIESSGKIRFKGSNDRILE